MRGDDRARRLAGRDLGGQVGAGKHGHRASRQLLRHELAHSQPRPILDALHNGEEGASRHQAGSETSQRRAHVLGRHGDHVEMVRLGQECVVAGGPHAGWHGDPR